MSEANLILLLQLVNTSGEVNSLLQRGLLFSQIAELITYAEEEGLIVEDNDNLKLTEKGLEKMRQVPDSKRSREDGGWISPMDEYRIEKTTLDDIYLPSVKTALTRLRRRH